MSECAICEFGGPGVGPMLIHWRPPYPGLFAWDVVDRCADRKACAVRVEAKGETWPCVEVDHSDRPNTAKANAEAGARRREYREWARNQPPGMLDRRPPTTDPMTGNATFAPPVPIPPIPAVAPEAASRPAIRTAIDVSDSNPGRLVAPAATAEEWW
jgi:hypothetical protein